MPFYYYYYSNTNYKVTFEIESIQLHCARWNFNREAWKQICSCHADNLGDLLPSLAGRQRPHHTPHWQPGDREATPASKLLLETSILLQLFAWRQMLGEKGSIRGRHKWKRKKKKSHNTEKEFKIGWSSGTGKYLARACGQKVNASVRLQRCLWDKKHIFVISFPNNIKFLNIFPYQGWKEAWEPQNSPRGMQNYYILMRLAHTASAGTGTTVLRKCRKSYELFLRQSSEPKLAAQHWMLFLCVCFFSLNLVRHDCMQVSEGVLSRLRASSDRSQN